MPRGDRTGPAGMGSMTGRGMGYCASSGVSGQANPLGRRGFAMQGYGRGAGRGQGLGRGRNFGWSGVSPYAYGVSYGSAKEEVDMLKNQASVLQNEMNAINSRVKELESSAKQQKEE